MQRTVVELCLAAAATLAAAALTQGNTQGDAAPLTAAAERGRTIYRSGVSPRGNPIVAVTADGAVELSAASMPCAGCHGRDGKGGREGGITPSDLTWSSLTKPYGITQPGGRTHPAYDEKRLQRAISLGIDPAGNRLHVAMPRFRMAREDMDDLIAYLRRLGDEPVPGVTDGTVRIGTLLPDGPTAAPVQKLLTAYFDEVNARGGVFGRRLELRAVPPGDSTDRRARVAGFLDREPVFALTAAFLAGADRELAPLFEERELPVVGAVGSPPPGAASPHLFYLLAGLGEQSRALLAHAARSGPPTKLAVVAGDEPSLAALADLVDETAADRHWPVAPALLYRPGSLDAAAAAQTLREAGADLLFFAGPGADQAALLAAAQAIGWHPRVLSPGPLAGAALFAAPPAFDRRLFLSFPTLPTDQSPAALADYERLAASAGLSRTGLPAQLAALAAARLLVEGLERAGRDLTREGLIARLEALDRFDTGLLPPLTYGPGRRTGARGAYIVSIDLEHKTFTPPSGWIAVE